MESELVNKITLLESVLKKRNNKSFSFFNKLLNQIDEGFFSQAVDTILSSYAIVQYGDFNYNEEILFEEIWNIANRVKDVK